MAESEVNPFRYGGAVGSDAFCNRKQEFHDLTRAAANGEKLFVYAERRVGKTSLARRVMDKLPVKSYLPVYIDLWPTDGVDAFIATLARELTRCAASKREKLADTVRRLFRHVYPSFTFDESGQPVLQFGATSLVNQRPQLEDVLDAPARIAEREKRRLVIVFDEFQRILDYESDIVERTLWSKVQMHEHIAYLFLGSRKHLMQGMFLDNARPLYRAAGHYPLGMIDTVHWRPFIKRRFEMAKKKITHSVVESLCIQTEGHPFYTQHLSHALWEMTPAGSEATMEMLGEAVDALLRREAGVYATLWETLSRGQQRLLRGLAEEGADAKPYSASFVRTHGIGSPSSAQQSAGVLLRKDILDREGSALFISDRFFRLWIQRLG